MSKSVERIKEYVRQVTGGVSLRSIAAKIEMEPSTLSRQFARSSVPVETVVAIARAYHGDLLLGLVEGEFITAEEAATFTGRGALADATDLQLAQETLRRMRATPRLDDDGADELDDDAVGEDVTQRRVLDSAGPHLQTHRFAADAPPADGAEDADDADAEDAVEP